MCRETDPRTARQFCYYTVAYADALFPPKIECSQFVAGPFYTMAECDSYIVTRFGVSRGQYFDCGGAGVVPGAQRRALNIYMCRETDPRTARQTCYYTVAYADALFPPRIECSQFVAGPFYTMADCDAYIVSTFRVNRGQRFDCQ